MSRLHVVRKRAHHHRGASGGGSPAFPDATNTGVPPGTTLTPSGSITTTADNQVIDALDITGRITVNHSNVLIKRCRIRQPGGEAIYRAWDLGLVGLNIEDCEMDGTGNPNGAAAVVFSQYIIRRCNVYGFGEGLTASGDCTIEDNYFHDFGDYLAQGAHQDGVQMEYGSNLFLRHNTCLMNVNGNSCFWLSHEPHGNVIIEDNLCAGGGYVIGCGGGGPNNNFDIRVRNNRISTMFHPTGGFFGPFVNTGIVEFSGNVWHETGEPV